MTQRSSGDSPVRLASAPPEQTLGLLDPDDLAERLRRIESIIDAALAHLELNSLLEQILTRIRDALSADVARVLLSTAGGRVLRVRASQGLEEGDASLVIPVGRGIAGQVAAERTALIVDDVSQVEVIDPLLRRLGAIMVAPLVVEGRMLGVLKVGTFGPRRFAEADLALLQIAADRVALAIDRARHYEEAQAETQRRERAEKALRHSEDRFRLLVQGVRDYAIFLLDPAGHVVSWNAGAERIKGYTEEEILGKHFSLFYMPEAVQQGHPQHELEIAAARGSYEEEGWRVRKDGSLFWANVLITAVRQEGQLVGFAKVTRDLTEHKLAEQQREELLAREQKARAEAEAANLAKTEFLAVMSHELRTPLTAIIGYAELLQMGIPVSIPDDAAHQVERIGAAARHQLQLIEEILTFASLEAGTARVHPEEVELGELVQEAASFIQPLAEPKGLAVGVSLPDLPVRAVTDREKFLQILINLLSNAVKFTSEGQIRTVVERRDERAFVHVEDTGIGIAPEHQEKIFDSFWQVEQSNTREIGGAGLGLSVARRVARLLGGDLRVESTLGRGSRFTLELPLRSAEAMPASERGAAQ